MQEQSNAIITYLCNWGFISKSEGNDVISVLNRGVQLIAKIRNKTIEKVVERNEIAFNANIGLFGISAKHSVEKSQNLEDNRLVIV